MEESREDFEQWLKKEMPMTYRLAYESTKDDEEKMIHHAKSHVLDMRQAWAASRAAMVVDIASHTEFEIEHMISPEKEGYSIGWIDGRNYSVKQVCAAGITVKGEGDE